MIPHLFPITERFYKAADTYTYKNTIMCELKD